MAKTAHSAPVHHAHLSSWQSRGTPLPTTRLPGTPVENANGHILGKHHHLLFWEFVGNLSDVSAILFEGVASLFCECECRVRFSLDELFGYFDVSRVFQLAQMSG